MPRTLFHIFCVFILLFSCSRSNDPQKVIRFWGMGAEGEHVQGLLRKFETEHPNIRVESQSIPWSAAQEKMITAFASDNLPDIFQLGNTWIPQFVNLNALLPLDSNVVRSSVIDSLDYFSGIWQSNRIADNIYGIPWYVDTRVLFYRCDILENAGFPSPPKTWKELYQAALAIKKKPATTDAFPLYLPTNEWVPFVLFPLQNGSRLLRENKSYGDFSAPSFKTAYNYLMRFYWENLVPTGSSQIVNVQQSFRDGDIAMYISGPWNVPETGRWMKEKDSLWDTAPLPAPDENYPGISLAGGASLVINRKSKLQQECWQLIEFLSTAENQLQFYREVGDLPARKSAWESPVLRDNSKMKAFLLQLDHVKTMPKIAEWEHIVYAKLQQYVEFTARRAISVDEALNNLDADVNRILEKRRWMMRKKGKN